MGKNSPCNYGDDDWQVTVRPLGAGSALYATDNARAFFGQHPMNGFYDAHEFVGLPGEIDLLARLHIALVEAPMDHAVLNSQQVGALVGAKEKCTPNESEATR